MTTQNKPTKNKSNKAWLNRHMTDHFVHLAQKDGYRSRAAYKLLEIDDQVTLFHKNTEVVVDLGCAPGGWSQVVVNKMKEINNHGLVIGLDMLDMAPIHNLHFIKGDFTTEEVLEELLNLLGNKKVDVLLSDMSPNLSGIKNVDQARGGYLIELAIDFAKSHLKPNGTMLIKAFQGSEFNNILKLAKDTFKTVDVKKPKASRDESSEVYLYSSSLKP